MPQPPQPLWRCSLDILTETSTEIEWLIDGVIAAESIILASGREGSMKTWLALEWARSVAEGSPWLGRACEAASVLYLDAENPRPVFLQRLEAIGGSRNLNVSRWQDDKFPTDLADPRLLEAAQSHRLIVVDSLRRFMMGREENSATDMARITDPLRQLTRSGCSVIAIHHAGKDPAAPGYRGSTELGAGVDVAMTIKKQLKTQIETLEITASKTRYSEDPQITLRVERTAARPIFHDSKTHASAPLVVSLDHEKLVSVIGHLHATLGRKPNQSEVIAEAKHRKLASRNTLLGWLNKGEGERWQSEPDGRSRGYGLLFTCSSVHPPGVQNGLDNSTSQVLSTCPDDVHHDKLDKWTDSKDRHYSPSTFQPVYHMGTHAKFKNASGNTEEGVIEDVVEWPGYPDHFCYLIAQRPVPPGRIMHVTSGT